MANYSKVFFSKKSAERFAEQLKANGAEDVIIWAGRDAFNQTQYRVNWN